MSAWRDQGISARTLDRVRRGEIWRFDRDRPTGDDARTPLRVILTASYRIGDDLPWILTAPIDAAEPPALVAVRLTDSDPVSGWIRVDRMTSTYRRWLTGPYGMLSPGTLESLAATMRAELDL